MMNRRALRPWRTIAVGLFATVATTVAGSPANRYSLDFTLSKHNFADTIAIEWEMGQVYVPVEMGGRRMRFLLDTGAGQTVIFDDVAVEGLKRAGHLIAYDANNRRDTVPTVVLPPLSLGTLTLTGCHALRQRRTVKRERLDGILGFDIVNRGLNLKIDVAANRLIVSDRKHFFDGEGGCKLRYKLNYHVPYVKVRPFGKYQETVLFDTGSRRLYTINKQRFDKGARKEAKVAERQVEGRSFGRHSIGHGGVEPLGEVVFLCIESLRVGTFAFDSVHTITTQGGSHVGAAILRYGAVVFNPHRRQFCFQPYGGRQHAMVDNRQTEMAIIPERGMPVVGLVWERGTPYRQGFREGDIIVKIDGKPVHSFDQYVRWGFEAGREYAFTVRDRKGFQRVVKWARRP